MIMKICILCLGTQGDILPYIALGAELKKRGHDVRIASFSKAKTLCEKYGLSFSCVEGDVTLLISSEKGEDFFLKKKKGQLALIKEFFHYTRQVIDQQLDTSLKAVEGSELLLFNHNAFAGPHLGEFFNIPSIRITPILNVWSKEYPSYFFLKLAKFGKVGSLLSHFFHEQFLWQPIRKKVNSWRKNKLHLQRTNFFGNSFDKINKKIPIVVTINPNFFPPPKDWGKKIVMTNFCRVYEKNTWKPSEELEEFVKKPVDLYVSLGSASPGCPPSLIAKMIEVLTKNKIRTIINADLPLNNILLPSWVFPVKYVPHDWILPKVKGMIHHGGVGTLAAALYDAIPMLIIPFFSDQFFWGEYIEQLKLGPKPINVSTFTANLFEERLNDLLTNQTYKKNVKEMQQKILEIPDGVDLTIAAIFNLLQQMKKDDK